MTCWSRMAERQRAAQPRDERGTSGQRYVVEGRTATIAADERPLEVDIYPRSCVDPSTVRVTVRVERNTLNRAFLLGDAAVDRAAGLIRTRHRLVHGHRSCVGRS